MFQITQWVMHHSALVPALVVLVCGVRSFTLPQALIALSLLMSWIMDLGANQMLYVLQVSFALCAVADRPRRLLVGFMVLTPLAALQRSGAYDLVVPAMGGLVICYYAWSMEPGLLRTGVLICFGLVTLPRVAFVLASSEPSLTALVTWYVYQATRLAGVVTVIAALVQQARQPKLKLV